MNGIRGRYRAANDEQVKIILDWHRSRRSLRDWASTFGVAHNTISSALRDWSTAEAWNAPGVRIVRGRKRALSVNEVRQLLNWRRIRKTRVQLAQDLGLSRRLIDEIIRRKGEYKRGFVNGSAEVVEARQRRVEAFLGSKRPIPARRTIEWAVRLRSENARRMHRAWELGTI